MALIGNVDEISRRSVGGWAMDNERPDRGVDVEILIDGNTVAVVGANRMRESLKESLRKRVRPELHAAITGLYNFQYDFPSALSVFHEARVEVRFAGTADLLSRGAKTLPRPRPGNVPLVPLLVTAAGRSGTTVLMQRLAAHPQIVAADRYPYEIKMLAYYSAAFRVLVADADRENSANPGTLFEASDRFSIGFNPFNRQGLHRIARDAPRMHQFFEETIPATMAETFRTLVASYYEILRSGQRKELAVYFAEKCGLHEDERQGARLFFGTAREILLVRDPRDILCSDRSFWRQGAGDLVAKYTAIARRIEAIHAGATEQTILIRYEDLIAHPVETMDRLYRFLHLDPGVAISAADEARLFGMHGTSGNPAASIGRWRTDLKPEEITACDAAFRPFLEQFGYS